MKPDRIAVAVALAFALAANALAATSCVQNKQTGLYEPKNATPESIAACSAMNKAETAAIAVPSAPATVALPAANRTVSTVVVDAKPAAVETPADPAQQKRTYWLKTNDLNVRLALGRWLKETNMQLAYEASEEFNISVEGAYTGTMPEVLKNLMTSLKQSKYPLRACEYDNRVVLVVHRNEVCPLEDE